MDSDGIVPPGLERHITEQWAAIRDFTTVTMEYISSMEDHYAMTDQQIASRIIKDEDAWIPSSDVLI